MRLDGKVCVITGAGGGMGRVASKMFAAEGAKVVVAEFSEAAGEETVRQARREAGGTASFVKVDVSSEASAKAMIDHAVATYGRVDVLYNNAGIMPEADHSVIDTDVATWDQVMAVNVRGVFLGCKYAIPQMVEQGSGSIINIASFVALLGCSVPQDAYTASKGALISLTRSLAVQFGPKGVRTNAICPGPVETPLLMDWLVKDEEAKRIRLARNPTGRFGKPEEIVHMALYLASDESRWTNGAQLVVDGGISINYFWRRVGMSLAIGVDVGGSGIKVAAVDLETGALASERIRVLTPVPSTPDAVIKVIARLVKRISDEDRRPDGPGRGRHAVRDPRRARPSRPPTSTRAGSGSPRGTPCPRRSAGRSPWATTRTSPAWPRCASGSARRTRACGSA